MITTQLISVRLFQPTLEKIDELVANTSYRNRSMIVNNLLSNILSCCDAEGISHLIDTHDAYSEGYTLKLSKLQQRQ